MKTAKLVVLAALLAIAACKKDKPAEGTGSSGSSAGSSMAGSSSGSSSSGSSSAGSADNAGSGSSMAAGSGSSATEPNPDADYFIVAAKHDPGKPGDPVEVKFDKLKVVKATFDPKKIEGGSATLEVDLASLKTNSNKRDDHLRSASYLDVSKFATLTIDITNVKKKDDKSYTATAKVKLHGTEKTYPVSFEVVDVKDDTIRIKGEQQIKRLDFKVGKKVGPDELVADDLTVKLQLTLKRT
jgi:polyisoprenoid-binding protein YceI